MEIPEGRWLNLPRRGRTWLTELPGPPGAPAIVLLHAVGCTGMLTWFPAVHELAKHYRVVVFDQRWHGRGIVSENFSLHDCADDVAAVITELGLERPIVAGYSMGSVIAQRVWRQHPDVLGGLVLAATTDHFRTNGREQIFHSGMEFSMGSLRALSKSRTVRWASRSTAEALDMGPDRHRPVGAQRVAQHQSVGRRAGGGGRGAAPLHSLAVPHRRAHRGGDPGARLGHPSRAAARAGGADPGSHRARGRLRTCGLRDGVREVRADVPRGRAGHRIPGPRTAAASMRRILHRWTSTQS